MRAETKCGKQIQSEDFKIHFRRFIFFIPPHNMKHLRITVEGKVYDVEVEVVGTEEASRPRPAAPVRSGKIAASPAPAAKPVAPAASSAAAVDAAEGNAVRSPLAALVVSIDVAVGDEIRAGDRLVTLEAMKMNTIVNASQSGRITAIHVAAADAVEEGQPLVSVE